MGKYEPLANFLKDFNEDSWEASFSEIEKVLGFKLPQSAHEHRAWWANQYKGHHSQAKGWIEAGWVTREIDQRRGRVKFVRKARNELRDQPAADAKLRLIAQRLSGISDDVELERAALNALIQREAGRALASMGGTMPDLVVPERERPAR